MWGQCGVRLDILTFVTYHFSMARKPRIHFPGAFYHVMLRGNGGQDIFFSDADRSRFYLLLQEGRDRYRHRIHAFCLMTNHVHLIIQVGENPLSKVMQNLSFRYTRYVNTYQDRSGHLFQGRYKALLIDGDSYLAELVRYIHCNPVRAGILAHPDSYLWSSHKAYLGESAVEWLTTDFVLSQFGKHKNRTQKLYRQFIDEGIEEEYREEFHTGTSEGSILGDDVFGEKVYAQVERNWPNKLALDQFTQGVCTVYEIGQVNLCAPGKKQPAAEARAILSYFVQETAHLPLTELANFFERDVSALSRAAGRVRIRIKDDAELADKVQSVKNELARMSKCQA